VAITGIPAIQRLQLHGAPEQLAEERRDLDDPEPARVGQVPNEVGSEVDRPHGSSPPTRG
jgi:hypothetical protein